MKKYARPPACPVDGKHDSHTILWPSEDVVLRLLARRSSTTTCWRNEMVLTVPNKDRRRKERRFPLQLPPKTEVVWLGRQRDPWRTFFGEEGGQGRENGRNGIKQEGKKIFPKVVPQLYTQPPPNPLKLCYESGVLSLTLSLDFRRTRRVL